MVVLKFFFVFLINCLYIGIFFCMFIVMKSMMIVSNSLFVNIVDILVSCDEDRKDS